MMKTYNDYALKATLSHVLGPEAQQECQALYRVIDSAMGEAYSMGRMSISIEAVKQEGFQQGYNVGYDDGLAVATGDEQPWEFDGAPMVMPPYEGDSGDETEADDEDDADGFYEVYDEDGNGHNYDEDILDNVEEDYDAYYPVELPPMQEQRAAVREPGETQFRRYTF